jgi:S-adenosylmethionine hydrolase
VDTYAQAAPGSLVALVGSNERLEIAVVNGSATRLLHAEAGVEILVVRKN